MVKTRKIRKGPSVSATKFSLGTKKKGNDGKMWIIVQNKNSIKRWSKTTNAKSVKNKTKKSKRVLALEKNPMSVWGKNKSLEKFWRNLASGKEAVLIYNNNTHKIIKLPNGPKSKNAKFDEFDNNPEIKVVLISNQSSDAYELLYKRAKNKNVNEVIKNYKKYFKSSGPMPRDLVEKGMPLMKKVLYPY